MEWLARQTSFRSPMNLAFLKRLAQFLTGIPLRSCSSRCTPRRSRQKPCSFRSNTAPRSEGIVCRRVRRCRHSLTSPLYCRPFSAPPFADVHCGPPATPTVRKACLEFNLLYFTLMRYFQKDILFFFFFYIFLRISHNRLVEASSIDTVV